MRTGPIAQRLPDAINGRDFISRARADRMKVPYDIKEARERFDRIVAKFQLKWIDDKSCFKEQLDLVIDALRIGAFCLPRQVLESGIIEMHLIDSLQKDLGRCMDALRKGTNRPRNFQVKIVKIISQQSGLLTLTPKFQGSPIRHPVTQLAICWKSI